MCRIVIVILISHRHKPIYLTNILTFSFPLPTIVLIRIFKTNRAIMLVMLKQQGMVEIKEN
jgi:hypothetical protein